MKGRILLVDDNVNLTTLLGKALSKCGYEAHAENDSTLAVNRVRELRPDLIVLDVMRPAMAPALYTLPPLTSFVSWGAGGQSPPQGRPAGRLPSASCRGRQCDVLKQQCCPMLGQIAGNILKT